MRRIVPLLLFSAGLLCALDDVELKWKFEKGAKWRIKNDVTMDMTMNLGGQEMHVASSNQSIMRNTVADVADGKTKLEVDYESAKVTVDGPGGKEEYDSTKDPMPTSPQLRAAAILIGKKVRYTIGQDGKLTDLDEFKKNVADAFGEGGEGFADMLQKAMEQSMPPLPAKPLKKGDSWKQEIAIPIPNTPIKMTMTVTYTFEKTDTVEGRPCAVMNVSTEIAMDAGANGPPCSVKVKDQSGKMVFDIGRGRIASSDLDLSYEMTIDVPGGKQVTEEMHQVTHQKEVPVEETK